MKKKKVTTQDIADALELSRNTVSKALNGSNTISEETRNKVMNKARELNYKNFVFMNTDKSSANKTRNIALFTGSMPDNSHFASLLVGVLDKEICNEGYNLSIHFIREREIASLAFPNNFEVNNVDGILCIELFDKNYTQLISDLGVPTIFIDSTTEVLYPELNADILLMENEHSVYMITKRLIENGCTTFGFVGDIKHCRSFNERWHGFNKALTDAKLQLDLSCCILEDDRNPYGSSTWVKSKLDAMDKIPSAFVCANDFLAIHVIAALKSKNIKIPEEVKVVGFDDSLESRIVDPQLTTSHIFKGEMGLIAAEMLLSRLKNTSKPFQIVHVKTEPIFRASTGLLK
ncbi:MAG: LacI family DNA-binding transcriptional regulator [Clostridiaceae bacterium]